MPLPGLIAALLPGAVAGIQNAMNASGQKNAQNEQNKANMELARYQYSKDLEMWNKGNAYNAPEAQMERLKKAGLNPNLVYGSGAVANSAGTLPKYNSPTQDKSYIPPVDTAAMINAYQDFRIKNAQATNTEMTGELLAQKEMMGRTDVDYHPTLMYLKEQMQRNKEGEGSWANFFGREEQRSAFAQSQFDYKMGMRQKQTLENQKLIEATRNLDLQNDYFAAKAITGLFGGAVGAVGKLGAMWKGAGKKGLSPGTLSDANKWRQFEQAYRRNR